MHSAAGFFMASCVREPVHRVATAADPPCRSEPSVSNAPLICGVTPNAFPAKAGPTKSLRRLQDRLRSGRGRSMKPVLRKACRICRTGFSQEEAGAVGGEVASGIQSSRASSRLQCDIRGPSQIRDKQKTRHRWRVSWLQPVTQIAPRVRSRSSTCLTLSSTFSD